MTCSYFIGREEVVSTLIIITILRSQKKHLVSLLSKALPCLSLLGLKKTIIVKIVSFQKLQGDRRPEVFFVQKLLSVGGRGWGREDGEVIAEGTTRCWSGVSFGGWSRRSGAGLAGCWQTGAEPTLTRTSWKHGQDTIREGRWENAK